MRFRSPPAVRHPVSRRHPVIENVPAPVRQSLAEARPGDEVEVVHILFGSLRMQCEEWGVRVGTRARVVERTPDEVRLELPDGGSAAIGAIHASFVEVLLRRTPEPHLHPLRPAHADTPYQPDVTHA